MFCRIRVGLHAFVTSQVFLALLSSKLSLSTFRWHGSLWTPHCWQPSRSKMLFLPIARVSDEGCLGAAPASFAPTALAHFSCPVGEDRPFAQTWKKWCCGFGSALDALFAGEGGGGAGTLPCGLAFCNSRKLTHCCAVFQILFLTLVLYIEI